jgi:hypothetical protein
MAAGLPRHHPYERLVHWEPAGIDGGFERSTSAISSHGMSDRLGPWKRTASGSSTTCHVRHSKGCHGRAHAPLAVGQYGYTDGDENCAEDGLAAIQVRP